MLKRLLLMMKDWIFSLWIWWQLWIDDYLEQENRRAGWLDALEEPFDFEGPEDEQPYENK